MARIARSVRSNAISLTALMVAVVGGGGGLAIAATKHSPQVHACESKSGTLTIRKGKTCGRGKKGIAWAKTGPAGPAGATGAAGATGPQGATGPTGPAGSPSIWANVSANGGASSGGLSVTHTGTGTYTVSVTASQCQGTTNALVVSPEDSNPPYGGGAGSAPVAWVGTTGQTTFTVNTGIVAGGTFTASDDSFTAIDTCTGH